MSSKNECLFKQNYQFSFLINNTKKGNRKLVGREKDFWGVGGGGKRRRERVWNCLKKKKSDKTVNFRSSEILLKVF